MSVRVEIVCPVVSEANRKEHWAKKKQRHDLQKKATWAALRSISRSDQSAIKTMGPWFIELCVVGGKTMDSDNLQGSCKFHRDEICRFLGVDDGDTSLVRFIVTQQGPALKLPYVVATFCPLREYSKRLREEADRIEKARG